MLGSDGIQVKRIYYFTHYLSFFSILLFSTAFSINAELYILQKLNHFGIYRSFMDVFSESHIKLTLWFVLFLLYFMVFSAMKLISDMILELSLYFFSKGDRHPAVPRHSGGLYFLIHSVLAVFFVQSFAILVFLYLLGNLIVFSLILYRLKEQFTWFGKAGLIFMHLFFWLVFFTVVFYAGLKLYNGFLRSLGV